MGSSCITRVNNCYNLDLATRNPPEITTSAYFKQYATGNTALSNKEMVSLPIEDENNYTNNNILPVHYNEQYYYKQNSYQEASPKDFINEKRQLIITKRNNNKNEDTILIKECLLKLFMFKCLKDETLQKIISIMKLAEITANKKVIVKGKESFYFYIIKDGECKIYDSNNDNDDSNNTLLTKGMGFGEIALINNTRREQSIRSITDCQFWILDKEDFIMLVENENQNYFADNFPLLKEILYIQLLQESEQNIICSKAHTEFYTKNNIILYKDQRLDRILIIKEGVVDIINDKGDVIGCLKRGEVVGEQSIIMECNNDVILQAQTNIVMLSLSQHVFRKTFNNKYKDFLLLTLLQKAFENSIYLNEINKNFLRKIAHLFTFKQFKKGEIVFNKNDIKGNKFRIFIEGYISNYSSILRGALMFDKEIREKSSECFDSDIIAYKDTIIYEVELEKVFKEIGLNLEEIIEKSVYYQMLIKVKFNQQLRHKHIDLLSLVVVPQVFNKNDVIFTPKSRGNVIYFIKSGNVLVMNKIQSQSTIIITEDITEPARQGSKKESYHYGPCSVIGTNILVKKNYSQTAIAETNVECLVISKDNFKKILGTQYFEYVQNNLSLLDDSVSLRSLEHLCELGCGSASTVYLVRSKKTKQFYACKCQYKKQVIYQNLFGHLLFERDVLYNIYHPFIVHYYKMYTDRNFVFFLMEYIVGVNLNEALAQKKEHKFNQTELKFLFASIMLSLHFLHKHKVIYRDIKPETILLKENGYLSLINFNIAKVLKDTTHSTLGSPQYLAPEVLIGEAYSFEVDYWSLAILMFQLAVGKVPFASSKDNANDPMSVYFSIINTPLKFPEEYKETSFSELLVEMLKNNHLIRLKKYDAIKMHPYFNGFDWEELENLKMNAPFIPVVAPKKIKKTTEMFKRHLIVSVLFTLYI